MAFHRIGNSIYSDDELRGQNEELVSILVPGTVTALAIYYLHGALSLLPFFVVHTTTAKLIYVFTGLTLFCISYALRKLIVCLAFLAIAGTIFSLVCMGIWQWLM
ncbi:hypothetical protein CR152_06575 [Massilia violaceinigra]|uniref:Uncharacterized protein n=1 Tax=Massilia violaceinigra TaxID=2045208 RepID=A0A2D2DGU8_9BURK|nr:hypothetical protein [Massilia violaceinigra]ATQ74200.1 hypothetical protein CR152_06575 [Massilia violaceinigra]